MSLLSLSLSSPAVKTDCVWGFSLLLLGDTQCLVPVLSAINQSSQNNCASPAPLTSAVGLIFTVAVYPLSTPSHSVRGIDLLLHISGSAALRLLTAIDRVCVQCGLCSTASGKCSWLQSRQTNNTLYIRLKARRMII